MILKMRRPYRGPYPPMLGAADASVEAFTSTWKRGSTVKSLFVNLCPSGQVEAVRLPYWRQVVKIARELD